MKQKYPIISTFEYSTIDDVLSSLPRLYEEVVRLRYGVGVKRRLPKSKGQMRPGGTPLSENAHTLDEIARFLTLRVKELRLRGEIPAHVRSGAAELMSLNIVRKGSDKISIERVIDIENDALKILRAPTRREAFIEIVERDAVQERIKKGDDYPGYLYLAAGVLHTTPAKLFYGANHNARSLRTKLKKMKTVELKL